MNHGPERQIFAGMHIEKDKSVEPGTIEIRDEAGNVLAVIHVDGTDHVVFPGEANDDDDEEGGD